MRTLNASSNELQNFEYVDGLLKRTYPCRCGVSHDNEQDFKMHNCYHRQLEIVGMVEDGSMEVYCADCQVMWIAPVRCAGVSAQLVGHGLSGGCEDCQEHVMSLVMQQPDVIDYQCPKCDHKWVLTKGNPNG